MNSLLNLTQMLPVKDLRKLFYAKLEYWDMELVKLAQGPSILNDQPRFTRVFESTQFQLWCAARGHLHLLKHIEPHLPARYIDLCRYAAAGGQIHVLQWLKDKGYPQNWSMYQWAARGGDTRVLQWLKAKGCPLPRPYDVGMPDKQSCNAAAEHGHLPALQWLLENGFYADERTCAKAAISGHLHVLEWLVANNYPFERIISLDAAEGGHLHVVQWLYAKYMLIPGICSKAARHGHLHILQWLKTVGCPCYGESTTCFEAAWAGHLEVLQWLVENGYPLDMDEYLSGGNIGALKPDIIAYLETLGPVE